MSGHPAIPRTAARRTAVGGLLLLFAALAGCAPAALGTADRPYTYRAETRENPRPLRIHILRADAGSAEIEPAAAVAPDPDGQGPATASLVKPETLARQAGLLAAVNANAFAAVPGPDGRTPEGWTAGQPVAVIGLAATGGVVRNPPQPGRSSFWTDGRGGLHIGPAAAGTGIAEGCAGFQRMVADGRTVVRGGGPLHPRTAVGVGGAAGKTLWLVVVDGRQPGYSEGMTVGELARLMLSLGCRHALNLDGGGSSVMLLNENGRPVILNRPCNMPNAGSPTRPVPVLIGLRSRR